MLPKDRKHERRLVGHVFYVDIRSFRHQHLNDVYMARIGCPAQRRFVRDIVLINVGTCPDQTFRLHRIASLGRVARSLGVAPS